MPTILLAVDGSDTSLRAADVLMKQLNWYREPVELHVVNIQPALPEAVTMFVEGFEVREYHQAEGKKAIAPVLEKLDRAKVAYRAHVGVGDVAHGIVDYAREHKCDEIVMGSKGLGRIPGFMIGSVVVKVMLLANVPVLLVK
jgi:nucleotide-binding universal stress UspA family protein